jgi:hypothetical protein
VSQRAGVWALVVVAGASIATVATPWPPTATAKTGLLVIALAALGVLIGTARRGSGPPTRAVVVAIGAVVLVAVCVPPRGSHDLWAYAAYGSIVARHDASPYAHRPAEYPDDPLVQQMAPGWRDTRSVYGPLFTALSAGIVDATGGRPLPTRLVFQGLSALCLVGLLAMLWRRAGSLAALTLVGLHPLVIVYVVNGGHNDALVALLLFGAAGAVARRPILGALLIGIAASVKLIALLSVLGLVWWVSRHHGGRRALAAAGVAVGVPATGYLMAGGAQALSPLLASSGRTSRAAVWDVVHFLGDPGVIANHLGILSAIATLAIGLPLVIAAARNDLPHAAIATPLLAYVLLGAYVLPWYLIWVLPFAALSSNEQWARVFVAISVLTVAAYQYASDGATALTWVLHATVPATQLVAVAGAIALATAGMRKRINTDGAARLTELVSSTPENAAMSSTRRP